MEALIKSLNGVQSRKTVREVKPKCYPVLLNCSTYPLNKSRSKFVSVGLSAHTPFVPLVQLHGLKGDWVTFDETEWRLLLENQGVISNYLYTDEGQQQLFSIGSKTLRFHSIGSTRVVTFVKDSEVCAAFDSICELWELIPLIDSRIRLLKDLQFDQFYGSVVKGIVGLSGDYKTHINAVLKELQGSENAACMYEILKFTPDILSIDFIHHGLQGGTCSI